MLLLVINSWRCLTLTVTTSSSAYRGRLGIRVSNYRSSLRLIRTFRTFTLFKLQLSRESLKGCASLPTGMQWTRTALAGNLPAPKIRDMGLWVGSNTSIFCQKSPDIVAADIDNDWWFKLLMSAFGDLGTMAQKPVQVNVNDTCQAGGLLMLVNVYFKI